MFSLAARQQSEKKMCASQQDANRRAQNTCDRRVDNRRASPFVGRRRRRRCGGCTPSAFITGARRRSGSSYHRATDAQRSALIEFEAKKRSHFCSCGPERRRRRIGGRRRRRRAACSSFAPLQQRVSQAPSVARGRGSTATLTGRRKI